LLGAVLNDAKNQGAATTNVATALANGLTPSKESTSYDVTDGKYIWISYKKITKIEHERSEVIRYRGGQEQGELP
jgi:methyl-galactoside transport system substrate-binding protein